MTRHELIGVRSRTVDVATLKSLDGAKSCGLMIGYYPSMLSKSPACIFLYSALTCWYKAFLCNMHLDARREVGQQSTGTFATTTTSTSKFSAFSCDVLRNYHDFNFHWHYHFEYNVKFNFVVGNINASTHE